MNKEKIQKQFRLLKQSEQLCQERESKCTLLNQLIRNHDSMAIDRLQKEISFLDHLLDQISPNAEINQKEVIEEIIAEILQHEASHLPSYQLIEEKERALEQMMQELEPLAMMIQKYHQIFERAASHLEQSKKRPFLASFFGRHPKVLLSYEIATLAKEGKNDLVALRSLSPSTLQQEFLSLLERIVVEADKKWNHALYERAFYDFVVSSREIDQKLSVLLEKEHERAALIFREKNDWIEKLIQ